MNELETRELRCFVAVAEELHFGRAASRLRVAQPALSRTIAGLERRMGVTLLQRTTRHVELTAAGDVLLTEARAVLEAVAAARRLTLRAVGPHPEVVVAVKPDGDAGLLEPAISAYARTGEHGATIRPLFLGPAELTASLRDGRADLALVPHPFDGRGLAWEEVRCEPRLAALPLHHRLAGASALGLDDFATEPVCRWADVDETLDAYFRGFDVAGAPRPSPEAPVVRDLAEALRLVELGHAVTFLARSVTARFANRAISWRHVRGLSPSRVTLVRRENDLSPAAAAFTRAVHAVASV